MLLPDLIQSHLYPFVRIIIKTEQEGNIIYENGRLAEASTRGDGEVGEEITHYIPAFENVPLAIAYKKRLVITGGSAGSGSGCCQGNR